MVRNTDEYFNTSKASITLLCSHFLLLSCCSLDVINNQLLSYIQAVEAGGKQDAIVASIEQASNAVDQSFSYGECYSSIDIVGLISVLDELQSTIVDLVRLSKKPGK